jgi:hypothetical protein
MTFISIHSVIIYDVLPWRTYETHPALSFKSGCDRDHIVVRRVPLLFLSSPLCLAPREIWVPWRRGELRRHRPYPLRRVALGHHCEAADGARTRGARLTVTPRTNCSPSSKSLGFLPCAVVGSPGSLIRGMTTTFMFATSPSPFCTRSRKN